MRYNNTISIKNENVELSDGDLGQVAGGLSSGKMAVASILTVGIVCAVASIGTVAQGGYCGETLSTWNGLFGCK